MKLTRRGWAVVALVVVPFISGILFGPRDLNAIAAPAVIVLVVAFLQVRSVDDLRLQRELPTKGTRGETVTIRLHVDAESHVPARLYEAIEEGLNATGNDTRTTLSGEPITYDLTLEGRGERHIGPTTIRITDMFGVVARRHKFTRRDSILVRPRVYPLSGPRSRELIGWYGGFGGDRGEFDYLREYRRGDPMSDIHWKSSAGQVEMDLVVKEFADQEGMDSLTITFEADQNGDDDEMADAVASIVVDALEAGIAVGIRTATTRIEPDDGAAHRDRLLDRLARIDVVPLTEDVRAAADVTVSAVESATWVEFGDRRVRFAELTGRGGDEVPTPAEGNSPMSA